VVITQATDGNRTGYEEQKEIRKQKKTKPIRSDNQSDIFAGIMQKFMKQIAEENNQQAEDISKKFKEVLSRIPVSGAA
jgi:predicted transcriptional regulator